MLWKETYVSRTVESTSLPSLEGFSLTGEPFELNTPVVLIGGLDLRCGIEREMWRRLMDERFPDTSIRCLGVILPDWTPTLRESLAASTPPSLHRSTYCWTGAWDQWRLLTTPDQPSRAFAALVRAGGRVLVSVNPATGEAWEEFGDEIAEELSRSRGTSA